MLLVGENKVANRRKSRCICNKKSVTFVSSFLIGLCLFPNKSWVMHGGESNPKHLKYFKELIILIQNLKSWFKIQKYGINLEQFLNFVSMLLINLWILYMGMRRIAQFNALYFTELIYILLIQSKTGLLYTAAQTWDVKVTH